MKKIIFQIALVTLIILGNSAVLLAQPSPPATPIDGGLGVLLAGGAVYALKKLRDNKKPIE